jgi:hypothetical protein
MWSISRMKNKLGSRSGLAHVHDVLQQVCEPHIFLWPPYEFNPILEEFDFVSYGR